MINDKNIVLIGMPGSGKTAVGKVLADKIMYKFVDVDSVIEEKFDKIFSLFLKGEQHFRDIESKAVEIVSEMKKTVIATGGGVVLSKKNMEMLSANGIIVFVDRELEDIVNDIDCSRRPLLADGKQKLADLYSKRYELYKEYADIHITNKTTEDEAADDIITALKEKL